jgi:hypothetical protein
MTRASSARAHNDRARWHWQRFRRLATLSCVLLSSADRRSSLPHVFIWCLSLVANCPRSPSTMVPSTYSSPPPWMPPGAWCGSSCSRSARADTSVESPAVRSSCDHRERDSTRRVSIDARVESMTLHSACITGNSPRPAPRFSPFQRMARSEVVRSRVTHISTCWSRDSPRWDPSVRRGTIWMHRSTHSRSATQQIDPPPKGAANERTIGGRGRIA